MSKLMKYVRAYIVQHGTDALAAEWSGDPLAHVDAEGDVNADGKWLLGEQLVEFAEWLMGR